MSETVIKVEEVSKQYRLGKIGTGTFSHDLNRWWHLVRGKEDPYLKIGEVNDRSKKGSSEYVWALQDISFDVKQGDVLGIIGKNGAGKSTLLKILSRTTLPTTGNIKIKGRVASLLEVGTGFHPELTGRENIFLNGAILGMTKAEIRSKFDEIVDFSGVEKYIDTPVKRYSSGMYVRLAFAVAAHLEPEILIIDEVLAVGDAEFQKKALGKMKDVSKGQGRTVLFVSHNMVSVKALCNKGVLMKDGQLLAQGQINDIIQLYNELGVNSLTEQKWNVESDSPGNDRIRLKRAAVFAEGKTSSLPITTSDNVIVEFDFLTMNEHMNVDITVDVFDSDGAHVTHIGTICNPERGLPKGTYRTRTIIPGNLLNSKRYILHVLFGLNQREVLYRHEEILVMDVEDAILVRGNNYNKFPGVVHPICKWETFPINGYEN